jgi:hypothetical protein
VRLRWRPQNSGVTNHHEGTKHTKETKAASLALSHAVIGAAIEVHREIGPGLLEAVYERALCRELWRKGLRVERQISVPISYKGELLDCQVKLANLWLGLLINFNVNSLRDGLRRVLNGW